EREFADFGDALDVDDQLGLQPPLAQRDDQVRAAGQDAGAPVMLEQQRRGMLDVVGANVAELLHDDLQSWFPPDASYRISCALRQSAGSPGRLSAQATE